MTDADPAGLPDEQVHRTSVHEQAAHLRRRIEHLAGEIAVSEESLAGVLEESARLRPHAADRLREAARRARLYAEHERAVARRGWPAEG